MEKIKYSLERSLRLHEEIARSSQIADEIKVVTEKIIRAFRNKGRVLLCGNGGSAADAQHIGAELSGKFYLTRPPLPVQALHTDTSYLTAVSNDLSYDEVYSRLVQANGNPGDVLIAISTSGNSPNVINALKTARKKEMTTIGLTGADGGRMKGLCDHIFQVPSTDTPRIQEAHILIGHIICELVESSLFGNEG
jgi:D-sedoheptulose 7-phosphate isomerase